MNPWMKNIFIFWHFFVEDLKTVILGSFSKRKEKLYKHFLKGAKNYYILALFGLILIS